MKLAKFLPVEMCPFTITVYLMHCFLFLTVAPMRGRGIARGLAAQANRHDPFRSRPPNTSRPPSMHVDDFMKLEKGGNSSTPEPTSPMRRESVSVLM